MTANGRRSRFAWLPRRRTSPPESRMTGLLRGPDNTPVNCNGDEPIPSAGPYYVASYTPNHALVLVRNPNYHRNRPHHFARIELAVGVSDERAVPEIEAGTADYTSVGSDAPASTTRHRPRLRTRRAVRAREPRRRTGRPQYFVDNTFPSSILRPEHAPVAVQRRSMRQAVNYAINRRPLAQLRRRVQAAARSTPPTTTCRPGCPATATRRLSHDTRLCHGAEAGAGKGGTAVLYTCDRSPCPEQAQIVKTDLAAIGLQVQINTLFRRPVRR